MHVRIRETTVIETLNLIKICACIDRKTCTDTNAKSRQKYIHPRISIYMLHGNRSTKCIEIKE